MIDIHNHVLPGMDDGPADMGEALAIAKLAVADGVTHLMATPHIHPGLYDNTLEGIALALKSFRDAVAEAGIPLAVSAAAEMRFDLEVMTRVDTGTLPYLGHWKSQSVFLLEFPHTEVPFGAERLVEWLVARDICPMIVHPERNRDILNEPQRLAPFLQQGCLLQVTASALTGQFGERTRGMAEQLVRDGAVTCLASDAHNTVNRLPCLSQGARAVEALAGRAAARALTHENPWQIVKGHFEAA
ncbi:UNVERIFIED_CONTAM: hypothetical protein K0B97_06095 [Spiribacter pallidus]|jgi:protein-tyrosine phosphatase